MDIIQIIGYIIIITAIILLLFAYFYNKIKTIILKNNSIESEIDTLLREKYDLLFKLITEIEKNDENSKLLKELEKLKEENSSSFEFERKLNNIENKIISINDNKHKKDEAFNDLWYELINKNTIISANVELYNKTITDYNLAISTFPSKIISIIFKYKQKKYFDQKDMYDSNIKDFKI